MNRASRCWEDALGDTRLMVESWIQAFQTALATQDPNIASRARDDLLASLDRLEGVIFL